MGREDREEKHVKCKLKRHKMEHNPRNGGKFLKVTLRFKTGYISTLKKKKKNKKKNVKLQKKLQGSLKKNHQENAR